MSTSTHSAVQKITDLGDAIGTIIKGKSETIQLTIVALLAEGHLLIEDVPGVGKTTLGHAMAMALGSTFHRLQFTSDLLPSDVLGVSIYNPNSHEFEFKRGPIFANIVLADEINRTTPKTQSALLEAMNESQVTIEQRHPRTPAPIHGPGNPESGRTSRNVSPSRIPAGSFPDEDRGRLSQGRPLPVEASCIVFPEIIPSDHMDVTLFDILGMSARFRRGQGVDLYLIRDYVTSDSARHLDWKASAKTSTLKTREFAAEESRQVLLAFDRYGKPGDEDRFESLVSYAASIALHLIRDDVELSLISDDWTSASGHSENLLQSILSYLALVEMSDSAVGPGDDANGTVVLSLREGGIANTAWKDISTSHSTL